MGRSSYKYGTNKMYSGKFSTSHPNCSTIIFIMRESNVNLFRVHTAYNGCPKTVQSHSPTVFCYCSIISTLDSTLSEEKSSNMCKNISNVIMNCIKIQKLGKN